MGLYDSIGYKRTPFATGGLFGYTPENRRDLRMGAFMGAANAASQPGLNQRGNLGALLAAIGSGAAFGKKETDREIRRERKEEEEQERQSRLDAQRERDAALQRERMLAQLKELEIEEETRRAQRAVFIREGIDPDDPTRDEQLRRKRMTPKELEYEAAQTARAKSEAEASRLRVEGRHPDQLARGADDARADRAAAERADAQRRQETQRAASDVVSAANKMRESTEWKMRLFRAQEEGPEALARVERELYESAAEQLGQARSLVTDQQFQESGTGASIASYAQAHGGGSGRPVTLGTPKAGAYEGSTVAGVNIPKGSEVFLAGRGAVKVGSTGGGATSELDRLATSDPSLAAKIQEARSYGYSDEEILAKLNLPGG